MMGPPAAMVGVGLGSYKRRAKSERERSRGRGRGRVRRPGAGLGGMRHALTCRERRREGERVRLCLSVCVDAHRKDGNPLGWLALGRGARGRGFGRSSGVHFGWKKSVLITNCLSSALLNAKTAFRRQNQKDRDLPCRLFIGNGCFNLTAGGRFWKERKEGCPQQGTSGRFTTRTEDLCTVQQKAIVQCPLVCSWGRKKLR